MPKPPKPPKPPSEGATKIMWKPRGPGLPPKCGKGYEFLQGSLNYLFGGDQTMQIYGDFEGFSLNSALFGLVI